MSRRIVFSVLFLFSTATACADEIAPEQAVARADELSAAFRYAAEKVLPATVKIISHMQTSDDRRAMEIQIPALKASPGQRHPGDTTGTGVLIDSKGIFVTNNHVIVNSREIEVELYDGRRFFAKKYRHDPATDLAVVWLNVSNNEQLPFAPFGNSDALNIGDWVIAIGNPFEYDSSVSAGIISAKGRSIRKVQRTEFLQTDAAINPGNSGGPLVNLRGEIIGINTAIATRTGNYEGIGFALPSNNAQWIADQLIKNDKVVRAWLGVETKPITPEEVRRLGLKQNAGVVIEYPLPNSPAAESGLLTDDVIQSFDGQPINAVYQLQRITERSDIGKEHEIIFIREGKRYKVTVNVRQMPPSAGLLASPQGGIVHHTDTELGLLLAQSTDQIVGRLKLQGRQGMVVMSVIAGSRAAKAGINVGMLIVRVDGKPVPGRQQYAAARDASSLSDGIVLDTFLPGGNPQQFVIKLGQ